MIYGLFAGAFVATFPVLMSQRFGVENISVVVGIQFSALAIGTFIGPAATGIMYDEMNSYFWAIMVSTICWAIATCIVFAIPNQAAQNKLPVDENRNLLQTESFEEKLIEN